MAVQISSIYHMLLYITYSLIVVSHKNDVRCGWILELLTVNISAWSSLITPDNQYAYIGTDPNPYIVILPNMTAQVLPYFNVQPYLNQKISRANGAMCATPDMTVFFMKGYAGSSFVRTNVTSQIGSGKYYIEQGNSVTSCLVSPDSKYVFSGMADGSVRRADALSSSFGSGYVGLYNLDSAIQGMRMLDDQRTILVWTSHQMLKFDYNDQLRPVSAQKLALQENFRKIVGMTVDREENFAYLYAYDASNYRNILTYVIKYDLRQRTIVQVANTTGSIPFSESTKIFLNANQDRLVIFVGYAYVLNPIDLLVMYTNTNVHISDVDYSSVLKTDSE